MSNQPPPGPPPPPKPLDLRELFQKGLDMAEKAAVWMTDAFSRPGKLDEMRGEVDALKNENRALKKRLDKLEGKPGE